MPLAIAVRSKETELGHAGVPHYGTSLHRAGKRYSTVGQASPPVERDDYACQPVMTGIEVCPATFPGHEKKAEVMYTDTASNRSSPPCILLRESYCVGKKVMKRTLPTSRKGTSDYELEIEEKDVKER